MALTAKQTDLLQHLASVLPGPGPSVVALLVAADQVLDSPDMDESAAARVAATGIREALSDLADLQDVQGSPLWVVSRDFVAAEERLDNAIASGGREDIELLRSQRDASFNDLRSFYDGSAPTRRRAFVNRITAHAGIEPLTSAGDPVAEYLSIHGRSSKFIHGEPAGRTEMRELLDECLHLLERVFSPPSSRNDALSRLASAATPSLEHMTELRRLAVNANHLRFFASKIQSPAWLEVIDELSGGPASPMWPGRAVTRSLKDICPAAVAEWLRNHASSVVDPTAAVALSECADELGPHASEVMLSLARSGRGGHLVCLHLVSLAEQYPPEHQFIFDAADTLLNTAGDELNRAERIVELLGAGITPENALDRIQMILWKIRKHADDSSFRVLEFERCTLETAIGNRNRKTFAGVLVAAFVRLVKEGVKAGVPTLQLIDLIPADVLSHRLRSIVYGVAKDAAVADAAIEELSDRVEGHYPTGEDLEIIDWLRSIGRIADLVAQSRLRFDNCPEQLDDSNGRHYAWLVVMPELISDDWSTRWHELETRFGVATLDYFREPLDSRDGWMTSSVLVGEFDELDIDEACARAIAISAAVDDVAATLRDLAKDNTSDWLDAAPEFAARLANPALVTAVVRGMAMGSVPASTFADGAVNMIEDLLESAKLAPEPVENDPWPTRNLSLEAASASVSLVQKLFNAPAMFGENALAQAVSILVKVARDRADQSGPPMVDDPMHSAINRLCTQALRALIACLHWHDRNEITAPAIIWDVLDEALSEVGNSGLEHRAIVAPSLRSLDRINPSWVDARWTQIFGPAPPDDLGAGALRLGTQWGPPFPKLLEREREAVIAIAAMDDHDQRAGEHVFLAMLWELNGYEMNNLPALLISAKAVSQVAQQGAQVLKHGNPSARQLERAIEFWRQCLGFSDGSCDMSGFLAWSSVDEIADATWAELTLQTIKLGHTDAPMPGLISDRAKNLLTETSLEIITRLLVGTREYWDIYSIATDGQEALAASDGIEVLFEAREKLKTRLLDLGYQAE